MGSQPLSHPTTTTNNNMSYPSKSETSETSVYPKGYEHSDLVKSLLFNHFSAMESSSSSSDESLPARGEKTPSFKSKNDIPTIEEYKSLNFDEIQKLWKIRMDSTKHLVPNDEEERK